MSGTAILCSGQGLQGPDMFSLTAHLSDAAPVFAAAAKILGKDPRDFVCSATEAELHGNKAAQILCCVQALAAWAAIGGAATRPLVVAGYSVGEVAAWGVAGVIDAGGILDLAAARAAAMDAAILKPSGLLAVRGLSRRDVDAICAAHGLHVAIVNGSDSFIIGGADTALQVASSDADARGARRTTRLPVGVPSHTPLLQGAGDAFRAVLHDRVRHVAVPGGTRLLSSIDAAPVVSAAGLDKLADQVSQTVEFLACMQAIGEAGASKALELGPGSALSAMVRGQLPEMPVHSVADFRSIDGIKRWLSQG